MADNDIKLSSDDVADGIPGSKAKPIDMRTPEEVFPDLGNAQLVEAMEALKKEENKQTQSALIEQVLMAKFFAPVEVINADGSILRGTGKIAIPKDAKFNFKLIQNKKGEQYFTVFTDITEFQKWNKTPQINTIIVVFPQIAQLAVQKKDEISGFVINPMGQNIIFSQDAINNLLEAMRQVGQRDLDRKERQGQILLKFGKPANVPDAVYGAFKKKLMKTPEVKTAYFCMLKQGDQEFYLFTLDIDADAETSRDIGNSLCNSAKMFLTKFPTMAAPVNSPFGEGARKVCEPFYVRDES